MAGEVHATASGRSSANMLVAVFVVVIGTDQAAKWWVWRHFDGSLINSGGYIHLSPAIRSWFANPVSGAFADVVGAVVLLAAIGWLLRRRHPVVVLLGGGLVIAGWVSNLLDRLGLHNVTAPGSARGVVDFIPAGGPGRYNVADLWIICGTVLLAYAAVRRCRSRQPRTRIASPAGWPRGAHGRIVVLIVVLAVIALAVASALDHGGVESPTTLA